MNLCPLLYILQHCIGSTVDVERVFSRGWIVLSHLRNRLKVQTVGEWLKAGLIRDKDIQAWLKGLTDVELGDERDVAEGWDTIRAT